MNKEQILIEYNKFLDRFKLKPEEFILGAGGALLFHGLRETTDDMDTAISNGLFDELLSTKKYKLHYFGETEILAYNKHIDLHRLLFKPDTVIIDGVCCYSLEELLRQKQSLNRPKDQEDIRKLKILISKKKDKPAYSNW